MELSIKSPPRPVKRLGRSIQLALQIICFTIIIIALNYLSCARHQRIDLTEKKQFTLSPTTEKYLKSDIVQKRDTPIRVLAVIRRKSPHFTRVYNLLEEYKRIAGKAVELEIIDPIRQTDRTLEIENTYYQPYIDDMIIFDARTAQELDQSTPEAEEEKKKLRENNPQRKLAAKVRIQLVNNLFLQDDSGRISAWQDEDIVTSSIIGAIEGAPRKIYFPADKVDLEADGKVGDPIWQNLFNLLWQQNILLSPIRLSEIQSIPEDAQGFALIGSQYDLDEKEIGILNEYWDRQKASLLVLLDPTADTPNLRIFLRSNGVTPRKDRVMTMQNEQALSNTQAVFSRGSEITKDLGGKSTIFEGFSSSLEVRESDSTLINKRIRPLSLIQSVDGWWGETRFNEESIKFDRFEDTSKPIHLAAAILRGQATSDENAALVSKMVIISTVDFLAEKRTRPEQADFIKSSVNWLVGRDELIGIGPQKLHRHKITLLDSHDTFITRIVLVFLPLASLLTAMIVWSVRRA